MEKPRIRFQRANYVVSNLDRSLEFYSGVLGLTLDFVEISEKDSYSYPVFEIPVDAKVRFAVLSAPDQPRVMALTEITDAEICVPDHPRRAAIVLETSDIEGIGAAARKSGFFVYQQVDFQTHDGRPGKEMGIVDADGNLSVLYQLGE